MKKFYNGRTNIKHKKTYNMVKIELFERLETMKKNALLLLAEWHNTYL